LTSEILVQLEVPVYPTEELELVTSAVKSLFPKMALQVSRHGDLQVVKGEGRGYDQLERIRMLIRSRRIRAAARSILQSGIEADTLTFLLSKQAASVGKLSFCEPSDNVPLGSISVRVRFYHPQEVVGWLTD